MWKKERPAQVFESYSATLINDAAAQSFKDLELIALVTSRMGNIQFRDVALNTPFGEPCRFLGALTSILEPSLVVEIGTATGCSARAFLDYTYASSKVITFDIAAWTSYPESFLKQEDFKEKLTQYLDDLSILDTFKKHAVSLANADLIYLDAPKDGVFEYKFFEHLSCLKMPEKERFLVIDDIRFLNMAALWRDIASPKFDATSIGHWSGTGLVDISEGLKLK